MPFFAFHFKVALFKAENKKIFLAGLNTAAPLCLYGVLDLTVEISTKKFKIRNFLGPKTHKYKIVILLRPCPCPR